VARTGRRTVCGMLVGAGLAGRWHHSRAHRFFTSARWDPDRLGLVLLKLIVGWLVPARAPLLVAIDDTLFPRTGRKVHAATWCCDSVASLTRADKVRTLRWGNNFVVAGTIVTLPFLDRPCCLPILARLWVKGGPSKHQLARQIVDLIAATVPNRVVHVVADGAYMTRELSRHPPANITLIGRLRANAALHERAPNVYTYRGNRPGGRPRLIGDRIGNPADLATRHTDKAQEITVTRYGTTHTVTVVDHTCLWLGVRRTDPVRVITIREHHKSSRRATPRSDYYLVTTDRTATAAEIIERYAARWSIEVTFAQAKHETGVGEARNRTRPAVERTVLFGLTVYSLTVVWYHLAGHHPTVTADHRRRSPWYRTKTHPSYPDMPAKLRRTLIAVRFRAELAASATPEEINKMLLTWHDITA
jgi:hypothetical protein